MMDVRFPAGFPHDEALMVALGQTIGAIHELFGVSTVPRRLAPVQTFGEVQMSSFALEAEGEAGRPTLEAVAGDASLPRLYSDLAALKLVMMPGAGDADARIAVLPACQPRP